MTKQELHDFCINNAGKIATGKYRGPQSWNNVKTGTPTVKRGRIIAFTIDQFDNGLILLEDVNGKDKKDLPNPLPAIPHYMDGWFRVVSPAKLGFPVYADSVVLESENPSVAIQVSIQDGISADVQRDIALATLAPQESKVCIHKECDATWCHRKYAGII